MDPRPRARLFRRAGTRLLGRAPRRAAGAGAHRLPPPQRPLHRRDGPDVDPRARARLRTDGDLQRIPVDQRPAARRWRDVGARVAHVFHRRSHGLLPLARAVHGRAPNRGALMDNVIAAHFLAGSILTLVLPVGLLVVVAAWWMMILRRRDKS